VHHWRFRSRASSLSVESLEASLAIIQSGATINTSLALRSWTRLNGTTFGRWVFTRIICFRAPYFGSISPMFVMLEPGRAVVTMRKCRKVKNHIGTIHAIAMANLCEIAAGTLTEVSIPQDMRWIPKGMSIQYLAKAATTITATADLPPVKSGEAVDAVVSVDVRDTNDTIVVHADITMYVTPGSR
jgi:acyl-coenzyme A thioesterase PaaI-like protein